MTRASEKRSDFLTIVCTIKGTVLPNAFPGILYAFLIALLANYGVTFHTEDAYFTLPIEITRISLSGLGVLGGLLSFLLVFRTNLSYHRFWEARGHAGAAIRDCRNLATAATTFVTGNGSDARVTNILRLIRLSFSSIAHTVHYPAGDDKWTSWVSVNQELTADEASMILAASPRPALLVLQWLRIAIFDANQSSCLADLAAVEMDKSVGGLISCFNGLTKIDSTPPPFAFNQLVKLLITVFISLAPFGLVKAIGLASLVVTPFMAYAMFGLDAISTQMMNPFGNDQNDLPLKKMTQSVAMDTQLAANGRVGVSAFPTAAAPLATTPAAGGASML